VPHALQFCGSIAKSTHADPHSSNPSLHSTPHLPALQLAALFSGTGQAMPHSPQFRGDDVVSMQDPLQFIRPVEQPALHLP
jgi:hypothetical protein